MIYCPRCSEGLVLLTTPLESTTALAESSDHVVVTLSQEVIIVHKRTGRPECAMCLYCGQPDIKHERIDANVIVCEHAPR